MGGNVRTGIEDNLFMDAEKTDPASNERLVQRIVKYAEALGRQVATPDQTRTMLGLAASA
jgi:3-keto-5-aminohexanoate cleavage enzyme